MKNTFIRPFSWGFGILAILTLFITSQSLQQKTVEAAASNVVGLQMVDWSDCSFSGLGSAGYATDVGVWMPWTGDSDNYDPDCVRAYLGNTIPKDLDIRIGIQAQDINTPCGFLWLFKCGDGGGTIVYGPWASESANSWTSWAGDADMFDADQWRLIVDTRARYGYTVSNFQLGIQVGDVGDIWSGGGGCTEQIGTARYTPTAPSFGWSSWASDNYDNGDYNCMRVNLVSTSVMNDPEAALTGTSTVYYGNSVNVPWTVNYINTTTGCSLIGRNSGGTIVDPAYTITANGSGSKTSIAITVPVTYTLTCNGAKPGSSVIATKTITPYSASPTLTFTMNPTSGLAAGGTSVASITATNSASCTLVGRNTSGTVIDAGYTYVPPPPSAAGPSSNVGPIYITNTGQTTWTVPSNWTSNNTIHVIGGGGIGGNGGSTYGGGGGAYSRSVNVSLTPGSSIGIRVGGTGGDTWFNGASCGGSSVCAKGGTSGMSGGAGGQASSGVGNSVRYSGGNGGTNNGGAGNGGGGGAAGPNGNGATGGTTPGIGEGAGGGGNGGGAAGGAPPSCCSGYNHLGGAGGNGWQGNGGGASGNSGAGGAGSNGGGGGGGDDGAGNGGGGGSSGDINGVVGSGGGGGGGGSGRCGASGGAYGGGAGGGCNPSGTQGIIVIYYTASSVASNTDVHTSNHTVNQTTDYTVTCTGLDSSVVSRVVRVTLNSCMLDGVPIANGGSANFYTATTPPLGQSCSNIVGVRGCSSGALTGNTSYQYGTCTDQGNITITANGLSPSTSVRKGSEIALAWDGGNSSSCTVTGTNGFSTTGVSGTRAVIVNQKTIFTAQCTLGSSTKQATVTVNMLPVFIDQ